ncbi:MAG: D-alanyl-D-alanine carboxypeptidase family protein [Spirochaetota bacterium]
MNTASGNRTKASEWTNFGALALVLALGMAFPPLPLFASGRGSATSPPGVPAVSARAVVIMDQATGSLLYAKSPDLAIPPASLTKLVTLHIVYLEIAAGRLSRDELLTIDARDCSPYVPFGSTLMYLAPGMRVSVIDLMRGAAVVSGNDAAFALARRISGSNEDFARLMNAEMKRLGLEGLHFVEPSGLSEKNMVTAREFAQFCRYYIAVHPESLKELHSLSSIEFPRPEHATATFKPKPGTIQRNKNNLVIDYPGCDGLKTGYIFESGFNLAATAIREGTRFVIVTLGGVGSSASGGGEQRVRDGTRLLDFAFAGWKTAIPALPPLPVLRAWNGEEPRLALEASSPLAVTIPTDQLPDLAVRVEVPRYVEAPIQAGEKLGEIVYTSGNHVVRRVNLVAAKAVDRGNFLIVLKDSIERLLETILHGEDRNHLP